MAIPKASFMLMLGLLVPVAATSQAGASGHRLMRSEPDHELLEMKEVGVHAEAKVETDGVVAQQVSEAAHESEHVLAWKKFLNRHKEAKPCAADPAFNCEEGFQCEFQDLKTGQHVTVERQGDMVKLVTPEDPRRPLYIEASNSDEKPMYFMVSLPNGFCDGGSEIIIKAPAVAQDDLVTPGDCSETHFSETFDVVLGGTHIHTESTADTEVLNGQHCLNVATSDNSQEKRQDQLCLLSKTEGQSEFPKIEKAAHVTLTSQKFFSLFTLKSIEDVLDALKEMDELLIDVIVCPDSSAESEATMIEQRVESRLDKTLIRKGFVKFISNPKTWVAVGFFVATACLMVTPFAAASTITFGWGAVFLGSAVNEAITGNEGLIGADAGAQAGGASIQSHLNSQRRRQDGTTSKATWIYYATGCGAHPYLKHMTGSIAQCEAACEGISTCLGFQRNGNTCWLDDDGSSYISSRLTGHKMTNKAGAEAASWHCAVRAAIEGCAGPETLSGSGDRDYRGCQNGARSGKTCQKWTSQSPHKHSRTPSGYPHKGLGPHNYCRNPDGEPTIWCYTTSSSSRWEYCSPKAKVTSHPGKYCNPWTGNAACQSSGFGDKCGPAASADECLQNMGSNMAASYDPSRKWCLLCSTGNSLSTYGQWTTYVREAR